MDQVLAIQIARLLNESDTYNCPFTTQSGKVYAICQYRSGDYGSEVITSAQYLQDIRGSYLSGNTLAARGIE